MPAHGLADRLGHLTTPTSEQRAAIARFEERKRPLRRGAVLVREHDTASDLFVLKRGMLTSYVLLSDGSRQILRFLVPSDLVATATWLRGKSTETVAALTDSIVTPIDRGILATTIATHPRLAALRIAVAQSTQQALSDRLSALGRTSAKARIAGLLLEIRDGLRRADPAVPMPSR